MKKHISLVTGCSGFIGSHVANELLKQGHEVVGIDDLSGGFLINNPKGMKFIQGSVSDVHLVNSIFSDYNFDYIYHLAAYAAEGLSHFIRNFNYQNNLLASINLINAAVNQGTVKTFVFTSSIAVYGSNQTPMTEELTPLPEDPYGVSKYAVELDLECAHRMFGMNYIIFRPHNVYGENQNIGDPYRNVIGIFMNKIMQGKPMTIFGDGTQTRAFSYIADVAPIIANSVNVAEAQNQVFNVGADKPYSVNELAVEVAKAMGVKPEIEYLEARKETLHAYCTHEKAQKYFSSLFSHISLEEGLHKMATWAKKTGALPGQIFENVEIEKNMPPSWARMIRKEKLAA
jgi:UDP-glucose 4-epimerase